ncbi:MULTISPECIES: hypothetical protein [unclassified Bradyrhizobium]|uniref:hypothetical protein n=1 Tax=unclassified Bradyrhizobium TaxID=2631580 RepID=UPI002FEE8906
MPDLLAELDGRARLKIGFCKQWSFDSDERHLPSLQRGFDWASRSTLAHERIRTTDKAPPLPRAFGVTLSPAPCLGGLAASTTCNGASKARDTLLINTIMTVATIRKIDPMKATMIGISQRESTPRMAADSGTSGS